MLRLGQALLGMRSAKITTKVFAMSTHHHTASERSAESARTSLFITPFLHELETAFEQSMHLGADLMIGALDQTSRVLNRAEDLGRQLKGLLGKLEDAHQDARQTSKMLVKESIQDGVMLCNEFIQGIGQVAHSAMHELEEIGKQSETIGGSVRDSFQDLPNPFRTRAVRKSKGKEPTIIPISIQDN
jgi:hypothetical protein